MHVSFLASGKSDPGRHASENRVSHTLELTFGVHFQPYRHSDSVCDNVIGITYYERFQLIRRRAESAMTPLGKLTSEENEFDLIFTKFTENL